jgi:uncharacterized protein YjbI with pentapeptide repeats
VTGVRVHNTTPFLHAMKVCSRRPPRPEMMLVVRATLLLGADGKLTVAQALPEQGALSAERYADDDLAGACIYPGDLADFKLSAEVTLTGSCYPPAPPARECAVQLSVGSWRKALRVVGDRRASPAPAEPFSRMPLGWERSYGGPGYAKNPVGRGHGTELLANVEPPDGRSEAANFGPINPSWRERASLRGKAYGGDYRKRRAPWHSEDFDWAFFHAAPKDQRFAGYLRGDEALGFVNMHPDAPSITSALPGKRVRAFLEDRAGSFRELDMRLDTLHCDLDAMKLYLGWRGVEAVAEDDLDDVAYVLIASEELGERPKDEAHYRAELEAFKADPTGAKEPVPAELLELQRRAQLDAGDAGAEPNPVSALLAQRLGDVRKEEQAQIADALARGLEAAGERRAEVADKLAEIAQGGPELTHQALPRRPGTRPDARLRPLMRKLLESAAEVRKAADGAGVSPPLAERLRRRADGLERVPHDPRLKELDPDYLPPLEPLSRDEPGPRANLAERELIRADLAGRDLSGANLEMAVLSGANLRGANLRGANLHKAMLYRADLTGADLTGARLSRADLAEVAAEGARFDRADLDAACLEGARLSRASFVAAEGEYQAFAGADLRAIDARGASFAHADFARAKLGGARLSLAKLAGCIFSGCHAEEIDLSDADLESAAFFDALMARAKLSGARAARSVWTGATLDDADLSFTRLWQAQLDKVSAIGADFFGADWREGRSYRGRFDRARFDKANLFGADLKKARLEGTRFVDASLYQATFTGAHGKGADFTGAVLTRSTLEDA